MRILIIEDEPVAAERMVEMVKRNLPDAVVAGVFDSIVETVRFLTNNPMPELMLMDIELVDGQSFEIFSEVKITCPVIFTTAYDEFVLRAFSVHSIDYLLKPIQEDDLKKSLKKFRELEQVYNKGTLVTAQQLMSELMKVNSLTAKQREHFLVRQGHRLISINVSEIAYFFSEERITFVKLIDGKQYIIDQPLENLEEELDPKRFFRASRKYLVERKSISNVLVHFNGKLKLTIKPSSDDDVIVSRDRSSDFKKWLGG